MTASTMSRTTSLLWTPSPDNPRIKRLVEHLPPQSFLSSCTDLVHHHTPAPPRLDANGYYDLLGVEPDCSRKDLRDAYMRLVVWDRDQPEKHALRTQAFKVLYNPETRAEYDELVDDEVWVDPWVEAELRRRVAKAERERGAVMMRPEADGTYSEEFGTVDIGPQVRLESAAPRERGPSPLKRWQTELVRAFARAGLQTQVAISYHYEDVAQVGVVPHRHGLVFLIGPDHLSVETPEARRVAEGIIEEMNK